MPTVRNTKLPALPKSVIDAPKVAKVQKQFRPDYQEVKPNLADHTARFISMGQGKRNAR